MVGVTSVKQPDKLRRVNFIRIIGQRGYVMRQLSSMRDEIGSFLRRAPLRSRKLMSPAPHQVYKRSLSLCIYYTLRFVYKLDFRHNTQIGP